jgi:translation initiation factor IF-3
MAFTPSSPSSPSGPSGPPSFPRPRFPRGPVPNQNKEEHRLNERIRVPQVRLIDEQGNQVGVVQTYEALQMARERGLDLMEVSPNAQPPVCKICDYGKFKYEKKKKEQTAKKKQTVIKVKEIQLRPQTEEHDLDYKFKNVRQFLEDGDKAKITIMFRGREITYVDQGFKIMRQLSDMVKDVAIVEAPPKLEGKKLIMILAPASSKKPAASAKSPVLPAVKPASTPVVDPAQPSDDAVAPQTMKIVSKS